MSISTQARATAAEESWELIRVLWTGNFPRLMALFAEFDLAKQQAFALVHLEPDRPKPMSELAATMFCDASNITGIASRRAGSWSECRRRTIAGSRRSRSPRRACGSARSWLRAWPSRPRR